MRIHCSAAGNACGACIHPSLWGEMMATKNAAALAGRRLHRIGVASSRLQPLAFGEFLKLRTDDIAVFAAAAELFDHIIIVRATNVKSLAYIGQKNYTPKPIDCKPKTADNDCFVQDLNLFCECAGLVVDPTVVSQAAFATDGKRGKAQESWGAFLRDKSKDEKSRKVFRRRETKGFYAVDTLRSSRHFGCLMLSKQDIPAEDFHLGGRGWARFKQTEMRYIHGDYDLYGLIDLRQSALPSMADSLNNRSARVLKEKLHGTPHFYTAKFPQIQQFLNNGFGCEMIQHSSQDHVAHQSDLLYVFYPEGYMYQIDATADAIREVYELLFKQEVTT